MALVEYKLVDHVAVVTLNSGENRFNPEFLSAFMGVLNEIERDTEAQALVVTSAHEKIWCNGIDLEWLVPVIQGGDVDKAKAFFYQLNDLFKRILSYPAITLAAISGHAFAGGAILSCAFDFRFMRSDRGYFCFPEVDLGIPFLPGMNALLAKALPEYVMREMELTGCRLTAEDAMAHHIVRGAFDQSELLPQTLAFAKPLTKSRTIVAEMKRRLNKDILHAIEAEDVPYIESGKFHIS